MSLFCVLYLFRSGAGGSCKDGSHSCGAVCLCVYVRACVRACKQVCMCISAYMCMGVSHCSEHHDTLVYMLHTTKPKSHPHSKGYLISQIQLQANLANATRRGKRVLLEMVEATINDFG